MIRVARPLGGIDLKHELVTQTILWTIFAEGDPGAKENGFVDVAPEHLELAKRTADNVLAALSEFKED